LEQFAAAAAERGQSVIYLVDGSEVRAALAVAGAVRAESADAVRELQHLGIRVAMLTGTRVRSQKLWRATSGSRRSMRRSCQRGKRRPSQR
jgi:cation transport ATPase